jgi:prevent-host-death family protein
MTIIGLKELRQNATEIVERAQKGERFTVVKRSKPVLTITAAQPEANLDETDDWVREYVTKHQQAFSKLAKK